MDEVVFTRTDNPRANDPAALVQMMVAIADVPAVGEPSIPKALAQVRAKARPEDLICVTGSFYLAGDVCALLDGSRRPAGAVVP